MRGEIGNKNTVYKRILLRWYGIKFGCTSSASSLPTRCTDQENQSRPSGKPLQTAQGCQGQKFKKDHSQ